jgi:hypothetical protein
MAKSEGVRIPGKYMWWRLVDWRVWGSIAFRGGPVDFSDHHFLSHLIRKTRPGQPRFIPNILNVRQRKVGPTLFEELYSIAFSRDEKS